VIGADYADRDVLLTVAHRDAMLCVELDVEAISLSVDWLTAVRVGGNELMVQVGCAEDPSVAVRLIVPYEGEPFGIARVPNGPPPRSVVVDKTREDGSSVTESLPGDQIYQPGAVLLVESLSEKHPTPVSFIFDAPQA
jgi:hypothetical protein